MCMSVEEQGEGGRGPGGCQVPVRVRVSAGGVAGEQGRVCGQQMSCTGEGRDARLGQGR